MKSMCPSRNAWKAFLTKEILLTAYYVDFKVYNFDEENKLTECSPKFMGSIYVVLQLK